MTWSLIPALRNRESGIRNWECSPENCETGADRLRSPICLADRWEWFASPEYHRVRGAAPREGRIRAAVRPESLTCLPVLLTIALSVGVCDGDAATLDGSAGEAVTAPTVRSNRAVGQVRTTTDDQASGRCSPDR